MELHSRRYAGLCKQPNARINRAARIRTTYIAGSTMKEMLSPLRLNELLDVALFFKVFLRNPLTAVQ